MSRLLRCCAVSGQPSRRALRGMCWPARFTPALRQRRRAMRSCRSLGFAPAAGALALLLLAACGDNGTAPAPAPATTLAFRPVADGPVRTALPAVAVEIHNASGGLVNATNPVTIALGNNPGRLILHASA